MEEWIVEAITLKCPKCNYTFTDNGSDALDCIRASYIQCPDCGFKGEVPPP